MGHVQDYLLLSFRRAGGLPRGILAFMGCAGLVGLALMVVLILAPARLRSQADYGADGPVGTINRVGKVVYGPAPNEHHCRRFQFDNRTAALEEAGETDCAALLGKRPQQGGHIGTVRDSFRR